MTDEAQDDDHLPEEDGFGGDAFIRAAFPHWPHEKPFAGETITLEDLLDVRDVDGEETLIVDVTDALAGGGTGVADIEVIVRKEGFSNYSMSRAEQPGRTIVRAVAMTSRAADDRSRGLAIKKYFAGGESIRCLLR